MAELDYALLADFAKVDSNGTLTTVGGSFTFLIAPSLPASHHLAIAGRVRATVDEGPIPLRIQLSGPDDTFTIGFEGVLEAGPDARPYRQGRLGHLFALNQSVPLPKAGLYEVNIYIAGEHARRLAFDVVGPNQPS